MILEGSDSSWEMTGFEGSRVTLWSEAKKNTPPTKLYLQTLQVESCCRHIFKTSLLFKKTTK